MYIGSRKAEVHIVPDYLLQFAGQNFWVLEAKAPTENVEKGKNVEQAFSYAIHKDIRVKLYALCNGRKFVLFHVSKWPPVFQCEIEQLHDWLPVLEEHVGVKNRSATNPDRTLAPDFGLYLLKSGLSRDNTGQKIQQIFPDLPLISIAKLEEAKYCINAILYDFDGNKLMLTADFGSEKYQQLLSAIDENTRNKVKTALCMQPFFIHFERPSDCQVGMDSQVGDVVLSNQDENYCPLEVERFF